MTLERRGQVMEITRWQQARQPGEGELRQRMLAEGLTPQGWSNGPGDEYAVHSHSYTKVLYCLRGSIRFTLPDQEGQIDLGPGDRMVLPAGTRHGAVVGPAGVACIEASRYER
jgi:quercetin dioxygenase-like cupin family protein